MLSVVDALPLCDGLCVGDWASPRFLRGERSSRLAWFLTPSPDPDWTPYRVLAAAFSATLAAAGLFAAISSAPEKKTAAEKAAAGNGNEGEDKVAADKTAMDKAAAACAAAASLATGRSSATSRQPITSEVVRIRVRTAL